MKCVSGKFNFCFLIKVKLKKKGKNFINEDLINVCD